MRILAGLRRNGAPGFRTDGEAVLAGTRVRLDLAFQLGIAEEWRIPEHIDEARGFLTLTLDLDLIAFDAQALQIGIVIEPASQIIEQGNGQHAVALFFREEIGAVD